ncbi:hypothetical protein C0Q70_12789 [Pomacea canaliculata]|uniref:ABC transmembrane type-1 domain-containing protein n=1 Tax=Pomacea canaliculata TaxID=400727 RepID=A0A2T7P2K8_POMCA|nr:hypothetical protein C0Q70_12789 [Pomacea canaliculata]
MFDTTIMMSVLPITTFVVTCLSTGLTVVQLRAAMTWRGQDGKPCRTVFVKRTSNSPPSMSDEVDPRSLATHVGRVRHILCPGVRGSMMLSMVALLSLIQDFKLLTDSGSDVLPVVTYVASALRLVSYLCAAFLTQYERRRHVITSGLQCVFWSLLTKNSHVSVSSQHPCPEATESFPSRMTFAWMTKYLYLGWRKDLEEADLFDLNPGDNSDALVPVFEREWELERERFRNKQRSEKQLRDLPRVEPSPTSLLTTDSTDLLTTISESSPSFPAAPLAAREEHTGVRQSMVPWTGQETTRLLIEQVGSKERMGSGYVLVVLMFLVNMVTSLLFNFSYWLFQIIGMHLKTNLIAAVYRKSLTMNSAARRLVTGGEIIDLMSVDCQHLQNAMIYFDAWTIPLQVVMVVGVLYFYIGPSVFAGLIVLLLLVPFNSTSPVVSRSSTPATSSSRTTD